MIILLKIYGMNFIYITNKSKERILNSGIDFDTYNTKIQALCEYQSIHGKNKTLDFIHLYYNNILHSQFGNS